MCIPATIAGSSGVSLQMSCAYVYACARFISVIGSALIAASAHPLLRDVDGWREEGAGEEGAPAEEAAARQLVWLSAQCGCGGSVSRHEELGFCGACGREREQVTHG